MPLRRFLIFHCHNVFPFCILFILGEDYNTICSFLEQNDSPSDLIHLKGKCHCTKIIILFDFYDAFQLVFYLHGAEGNLFLWAKALLFSPSYMSAAIQYFICLRSLQIFCKAASYSYMKNTVTTILRRIITVTWGQTLFCSLLWGAGKFKIVYLFYFLCPTKTIYYFAY